LIATLAVAPFERALAQSHDQIQAVTKPQIDAVAREKSQRTPSEQKMASQILDALAQVETGQVNSGAPTIRAAPLPQTAEGVEVIIRTSPTPAADLLTAIAAKGRVMREDPGEVTAVIPLQVLQSLADRDDVMTIRPLQKPVLHNQGLAEGPRVATEGAVAHAVDAAFAADFGATGAGVVVCVISDSVEDYSGQLYHDAVTIGAISPANVHILPGQGGSGSGEGLAMLEIVHAIAPHAELWFATGFGGPNQMATNIRDLAKSGCQVIIDDLSYPEESPFQDGPISAAVTQVSDAGVMYFSSAGNSGNQHHRTSAVWEGDFSDGGPVGRQYGVAGRMHMWRSGITLNTVDQADGNSRVELYWSDPLRGSTNDYDLFVVNADGEVLRKSNTSRVPGSDPYQTIDGIEQGESIVVVKADGAKPRYLHLSVGRSRLRHATGGSVRGHNASGAENAFSIAAKGVPKPLSVFAGGARETVRDYSSDGPRRIFYDAKGQPFTPGDVSASGGRLLYKPDLTAADGVSTTLPEGTWLNPFRGTSAAAPHAGAIAALLLSCATHPSVSQVREALKSTAVVLGVAQSNIAGYGVVAARAAAEKICKPIPPLAAAAQPPAGAP
jgi:subtilisin family serine protease